MGAAEPLVLPLAEAAAAGGRRVGGKAARLAELMAAGYRVPPGFCITTLAYRRFVAATDLAAVIRMELGRKAMAAMRWEEIWDAALRIRTAFLRAAVPDDVARSIAAAHRAHAGRHLAVRSSAVGEDSGARSHAGLHDSVVGVAGEEALLDAVRVVWASLWSDAALLYRGELALDATRSEMAVVVQELVAEDRSGVGFGRDPRDPDRDRQVIEAVPGLCQDLVDGAVDPDRWLVRRSSGDIIEWKPGVRGDAAEAPLLDAADLARIHRALGDVEDRLGWPPDIEWTGRGAGFTLLQARPITTGGPPKADDRREWYLSLRPGRAKLAALSKRVAEDLIPRLQAEGRRLAAQAIEHLPDRDLAAAIDERAASLAAWKKTYWDEFIPFAHGVRQLGQYYNDAVKPDDSYEFVGLLRRQPMIAAERDAALRDLAARLAGRPDLVERLRAAQAAATEALDGGPPLRDRLAGVAGGADFAAAFDAARERFLDVAYGGEALDARPDLLLHAVLELAAAGEAAASPVDGPVAADLAASRAARGDAAPESAAACEARLLSAVGPDRREEALSVIEIGRLSWRLRDDDNVLLGRVEKQLLRALDAAAARLVRAGRLVADARPDAAAAPVLGAALRDAAGGRIVLPAPAKAARSAPARAEGETPRQVVGQPAAPGLATATARVFRGPEDLKRFRAGEVLICDAIQPTMSHIVPLAAAVVERRGGMLIHGAIIARELGIPCVNGVSGAVLTITDGEIVTVDGYLGIVTIGPPEFDLEAAGAGPD